MYPIMLDSAMKYHLHYCEFSFIVECLAELFSYFIFVKCQLIIAYIF